MSSKHLHESDNPLCTQCSKQTDVRIGREALADYVRDRMLERNFSTHEVSRRAKAVGYSLSNGTVSNILNCKIKDVKEDTLKALARALEVSEDEIFATYRGNLLTEPGAGGQKVLNFYNEMSPTAQRHFELIGEVLWRESKHATQDVAESGGGRKNRLIPPGGRRMPTIIKGSAPSDERDKKRA